MKQRDKIYFDQSHKQFDEIYCCGRIYDSELKLISIAQKPEILNSVEAELAMSYFDSHKQSWRLIRDFGQSQLYYAFIPGGFVWSFSYHGILELLNFPPPNEDILFDYLATHYRYVFQDPQRTFHQGILQVPAGSYVDIDTNGSVSITQWLDLSFDPETYSLSPDQATDRFMEILKQSVEMRAKKAKNPAFSVSSGLDSATVASLSSSHIGSIDAFSVGYAGDGAEEYDETEGIKLLTEGRDWSWNNLILQEPDLVYETKRLIELSHSPIITATWLSYFMMAEKIGNYQEIFTGLGGDECLAGEYLHFFYFFADLYKNGEMERLEKEREGWSRLHDHPVFKKNKEVMESFWKKNINFQSGEMAIDQNTYKSNWRFFNQDWLKSHTEKLPPMPRPYPFFLSNKLYQELRQETTPPTLWGFWRTNEILGLRGISPFLSPRLFKLCLSLPGSVKYDNGMTKALIRRGLKGILPEPLRLNSKKVGFNAPIHQWFRQVHVKEALLDLLTDGPLNKLGWLKPGAGEEIFREHENGHNHMMLLWPLLNTSLFL